MPNHIHGIIIVGAGLRACPDDYQPGDKNGQPQGAAPTLSLSDVVHRFKTLTTKRYTDGVKQHGWPPFSGRLWQRNYFEYIVRNEDELNRIRFPGTPCSFSHLPSYAKAQTGAEGEAKARAGMLSTEFRPVTIFRFIGAVVLCSCHKKIEPEPTAPTHQYVWATRGVQCLF